MFIPLQAKDKELCIIPSGAPSPQIWNVEEPFATLLVFGVKDYENRAKKLSLTPFVPEPPPDFVPYNELVANKENVPTKPRKTKSKSKSKKKKSKKGQSKKKR